MKNSRKGFTIVELVIVIAVIAILAGVLIPTFSNVIANANQSAALQKATSAMKQALAMSSNAQLNAGTKFVIFDTNKATTYRFSYENNAPKADTLTNNAYALLAADDFEGLIVKTGTDNSVIVALVKASINTSSFNAGIAVDGDYVNCSAYVAAEPFAEKSGIVTTSGSESDVTGLYTKNGSTYTEITAENTKAVAGTKYYEYKSEGMYTVADSTYSAATSTYTGTLSDYYTIKVTQKYEIYTNSDFASDIVVFLAVASAN